MLHTVEAVIDQTGHVQWLEDVQLHTPQRVLITLLDPVADELPEQSEAALSDWLRDEEDAAWAHLQPVA